MKVDANIDLQMVERHLTHHVAHELQNTIGAVSVYLDMLLDDTDDPRLIARFDKMANANRMLQEQVDALRHIIPRGDGRAIPLASVSLLKGLGHLFGTLASRISITDNSDHDLMLGGEVALLFHLLYNGANYYFGLDPMAQIRLEVVPSDEKNRATIRVTPSCSPAIGVEKVLHIPPSSDVKLQVQDTGFVLIWPCAGV